MKEPQKKADTDAEKAIDFNEADKAELPTINHLSTMPSWASCFESITKVNEKYEAIADAFKPLGALANLHHKYNLGIGQYKSWQSLNSQTYIPPAIMSNPNINQSWAKPENWVSVSLPPNLTDFHSGTYHDLGISLDALNSIKSSFTDLNSFVDSPYLPKTNSYKPELIWQNPSGSEKWLKPKPIIKELKEKPSQQNNVEETKNWIIEAVALAVNQKIDEKFECIERLENKVDALLSHINQQKTTTLNSNDKWMDNQEVMDFLKISASTLYRQRQLLKPTKIGSKNLYLQSEIEKHLRRFMK